MSTKGPTDGTGRKIGRMENPSLESLIFGFVPSQILFTAVSLGVPDVLADGRLASAEVAGRAGTHPRSTYRLLRGLATIGVVAEAAPDRFELTEFGQPLRDGVPGSVRSLVLHFCSAQKWQAWGQLRHTVTTGENAFGRLFGMGVFDVNAGDPTAAAIFNQAMSETTRQALKAIVTGFDFARYAEIVDVGGGDGTLLAAILEANPNVHGTVMDSPEGTRATAETLAGHGVLDRSRVVVGDFFESVPAGGDLYVLKTVLHDWDDDHATRILASCRRAIPEDSALLIVDHVLPEVARPGEDVRDVLSDIHLMVQTGGCERTESMFRDLLETTGFELNAVGDRLDGSGYRFLEATPV
jgi:O-methyltransferase domain/Dimerisation domain